MFLLVLLLKRRLVPVLLAVFSIVAVTLISLWWNACLSAIIDTVSAGESLAAGVIARAFFVMLAWAAASYISSYISGYACEYVAHDLRVGYARYFASLPVIETEKLNAGEQMSKLQNEIADVSGYLDAGLLQLFGDSVRFIITLSWLLSLNWELTLAVNLPTAAILIYVLFSSKVISGAIECSQQAKVKMNRYADALLALFPVVRIYDASRMIFDKYKGEVHEWERQTVRVERIKARLMSLSGLLSNIPLMLLFFIGGRMSIGSVLSIGTIYIFLNLSGNVSGVMMNMPGFISAYRQFSVNMKRIAPKIKFDEG